MHIVPLYTKVNSEKQQKKIKYWKRKWSKREISNRTQEDLHTCHLYRFPSMYKENLRALEIWRYHV